MKTAKYVLAAALGAVLLAGPAVADVVKFEGTFKFTKKNAACDGSVAVGVIAHSRFHPPTSMAPANSNWFGIGRAGDTIADGWGNWGAIDTTFRSVNYGKVTERFSGRSNNLDPSGSLASMRLLAKPTGLTQSTKFVTLNGQIKNPFSLSTQINCIVDFTAVYFSRDYRKP